MDIFDIVIPVGPNDNKIIEQQIVYTKKNIIGYRNIYLICGNSNIIIKDCIIIDEKIFPFSIDTVIKYHKKNNRNGWYLQQLLKLYAGFVIPDILEKYLVLDADTFFLKPTKFIVNNRCLYNYGNEYHVEYFKHMSRFKVSLTKVFKNRSGICHHMMFNTTIIKELFDKIEKKHNNKFYILFLKLVKPRHKLKSGASEYEIYFNYVFKFHPDKVKLRGLRWKDVKHLNNLRKCDYVSYHWYLRKN